MSGYRLAAMAAVAIAAVMAGAPSIAEEKKQEKQKRPQIETTKVDGTENVYIFRNGNHQAMFVVTNAGVIATDPVAYGRPDGGKQYVDAIRKVTDKPIRYLIYSHHHFDHIAGGQAFKDAGALIIAHRNARRRLAAIRDPHTPVPDRSVGNYTEIRLGGTRLELHYLGRNHSDSTLVMRLPREKIIFVVDSIPVGSMPARGMIDSYPLEYERFLKRVLAMDWERLIPGHPGAPDGRLGTKKDVEFMIAFMRDASSAVQKVARDGGCWVRAEKEVTLPQYENLPNYKAALPFVITRYCGLWGRGS
jgi:glyoxylase-like metal-dependent hydrolase (beta-lactamase superfamily II)